MIRRLAVLALALGLASCGEEGQGPTCPTCPTCPVVVASPAPTPSPEASPSPEPSPRPTPTPWPPCDEPNCGPPPTPPPPPPPSSPGICHVSNKGATGGNVNLVLSWKEGDDHSSHLDASKFCPPDHAGACSCEKAIADAIACGVPPAGGFVCKIEGGSR